MKTPPKIIVVGGSAGSFQVVTHILANLDKTSAPFVMCLHRLKHVRHGFVEALSTKSRMKVSEPLDKEKLSPGQVYLAPANYHIMAEIGNIVSLSTDEMVNYSRPSIDVTLDSFSSVYRNHMLAILLSGANTDGCWGLARCAARGGTTIVQNPNDAEVTTMPLGAMKIMRPDYIMNRVEITEYLQNL